MTAKPEGFTEEEVKAAASVIAVENGRRRDLVKPDYKQPTYVRVYLHQSEALVWAAGEWVKMKNPEPTGTAVMAEIRAKQETLLSLLCDKCRARMEFKPKS